MERAGAAVAPKAKGFVSHTQARAARRSLPITGAIPLSSTARTRASSPVAPKDKSTSSSACVPGNSQARVARRSTPLAESAAPISPRGTSPRSTTLANAQQAAKSSFSGFAPSPRRPVLRTSGSVRPAAAIRPGAAEPRESQDQDQQRLRTELQELLGNEFASLSPQSIQKLIHWKLNCQAPEALSSQHSATVPDVGAADATPVRSLAQECPGTGGGQSSPSVDTSVSVPRETERLPASEISSTLTPTRTAVDDPSSAVTDYSSRTVLQDCIQDAQDVFQLQVQTLSGEVLAVLDQAQSTWTRKDIVEELMKAAPLPPSYFHKLTCSDAVLNGARTIGELGLCRKAGSLMPSLVAVTLMNAEQPALQQALDGILGLTAGDVGELFAMRTPPGGVLLTARALGNLLCVRPIRLRKEDGNAVDDYWASAKRSFFKSRDELVARLTDFDVDKDPAGTIAKLAPFIENGDFAPKAVGKASLCCQIIVSWCHVLHRYSQIIA